MARDFYINGETLVSVKGPVNSNIAALSQLGLSDDMVRVTPTFYHDPLHVEAWGKTPVDMQVMLLAAKVHITLIHYDVAVLNTCIALSMAVTGGTPGLNDGTTNRAGTRLGNNQVRFAAGNSYIGLNLYSPIGGIPYRFLYCYLLDPTTPLGVQKTVVDTTWQAVLYTQDPAGIVAGQILGATGAQVYDHTLDT